MTLYDSPTLRTSGTIAMRWIVRNARTEDVLEDFSKRDGSPIWTTNDNRAKWFNSWNDVSTAVDMAQKFNAECYPEVFRETKKGKR